MEAGTVGSSWDRMEKAVIGPAPYTSGYFCLRMPVLGGSGEDGAEVPTRREACVVSFL